MTTWKEIGEDGPPKKSGVLVWVWWVNLKKPLLLKYYKADNIWKPWEQYNYAIDPTDQWTPIVPPDPPEED